MTNINTTQNKAGYDGDYLSQLWLTTSEVAKLTGKTEQSIRKSCDKANGKYRGGVYEFRKPGRNYEILLSSIPNNAQEKYRIQALEALKPAITSPNTQLTVKNQTAPTGFSFELYQAMAAEYDTKCASIKAEAERRLNVLDEYYALRRLNILWRWTTFSW